jgi:hypothetical protein
MYVIVTTFPRPIGPFETQEAAERYANKHCGPQRRRRSNQILWDVQRLQPPASEQVAA